MLAFKCDVCGAYYEPYNYFGNQSDGEPNTLMTYAKHVGMRHDTAVTRYDVCPLCMKAVNKLIEERKRHGPSIGGNEND